MSSDGLFLNALASVTAGWEGVLVVEMFFGSHQRAPLLLDIFPVVLKAQNRCGLRCHGGNKVFDRRSA